MQKLHNFMDKMRQKPVEERRRLLRYSTAAVGGFIAIFGVWNISNNLISLNSGNNDVAAVVKAPSLFTVLGDNISRVWSSTATELKNINDKLGSSDGNQNLDQSQTNGQ